MRLFHEYLHGKNIYLWSNNSEFKNFLQETEQKKLEINTKQLIKNELILRETNISENKMNEVKQYRQCLKSEKKQENIIE